MNTKGQGALEYLLLIGGAIVVAVVVVTLLLNLGASGGGATSSTAAASLCAQKAAVKTLTNGASQCDYNGTTIGQTGADFSTKRIVYTDKCYSCGGAYPSCTATSNTVNQAGCVST